MQEVREIVTKALEMRQKAGHKVRQPLASLTIAKEFSQELLDIIAEEVNVKEVLVGGVEIALDTNITEELKNEGIARDIIRAIQDARKAEGLSPSDKISLTVNASDSVQKIVNSFADMIKSPTQVEKIIFSPDEQKHKVSVEGESISLSITR
jgi:isoleucyl-tRNA synthetase